MSDNRDVAKTIITEAARTILKDRPGIHGSAENSFEMIGDLWTVYIRHAKRVRGNDGILGEDVAEMMTMLKKARKIYGQSSNIDNDIDDVGYAALAGMLRLPDPAKTPEQEIADNLRVDEATIAKPIVTQQSGIDDRTVSDRAAPFGWREDGTPLTEAEYMGGVKSWPTNAGGAVSNA